ncbi:spore coat protein [Paenibacillus thermotolerans]|uniref:spore coat protein n=1 Tax=Paenibacillus thermotolerans TaxID=3027807 RepID=UPI003CC5DF88
MQTQNQSQSQSQNQSSNVIKNPKPPYEPKVKGPELNDRDRVNDILALEKYLTDSFNVSAREASHRSLHQDIMTVLNETHQCQYEMFELMFRKGHYKLEAEQQQKLDQAYGQFSGYSSQFPYPDSMTQ